jgi:N12 class adenine-specific DNA methylase
LGIDCLLHDEAHHLKNLFGVMRSGDIAFLNTPESNRSLDFYNKAKYTREQNNGQNVYLLTATPTTNNPLEAFNMLQHVAPEEFDKRGISNIDDFLEMFGKIEEVMVPGVDLEMTTKNGLTGFKNLKDLRSLFNKYTRMQSAKEVGLPIPEEAGRDVQVDMTPAQAEVYEGLRQRADDLLSGKTDAGDDHIFSVISDMDKAAIDLEYYNATTTPGNRLTSTHRNPADRPRLKPRSIRSCKVAASQAASRSCSAMRCSCMKS